MCLAINSLKDFKSASAFYLGFATGKLERRLLVSNVSAGNMLLASYRLSRPAQGHAHIPSVHHCLSKPASVFPLNARDNSTKVKLVF